MEGQPLLANSFRVLIDGVEVGISEVSPVSSETGPSGEPSYRAVVLRRALTGARDLYRWREQAHAGEETVRTVEIRHYDSTGDRLVGAWELEGAWPSRWSGPALDANDGGTIACEELELAYTRLVWREEGEET